MGFMTEISIFNDNLGQIEKDPVRFVRDIRTYMDKGGEGLGQTTILPSHHADDAKVYIAHQNCFMNFDSPRPIFGEYDESAVRRYIELKLSMMDRALEYLAWHRKDLERDLKIINDKLRESLPKEDAK